jgi:hypothetical protein
VAGSRTRRQSPLAAALSWRAFSGRLLPRPTADLGRLACGRRRGTWHWPTSAGDRARAVNACFPWPACPPRRREQPRRSGIRPNAIPPGIPVSELRPRSATVAGGSSPKQASHSLRAGPARSTSSSTTVTYPAAPVTTGPPSQPTAASLIAMLPGNPCRRAPNNKRRKNNPAQPAPRNADFQNAIITADISRSSRSPVHVSTCPRLPVEMSHRRRRASGLTLRDRGWRLRGPSHSVPGPGS